MGALTMEQAIQVKKHLGGKTTPLASTIARLLLSPASGDSSGSWINTELCGALVLVVDRVRYGAKIVKLFDMNNWNIIFEQELYVEMKYEAKASYFHCFEIDQFMVGLDFIDEDEAAYFYNKMISNIPSSLTAEASSRASVASDDSNGKSGRLSLSFGSKKRGSDLTGRNSNFFSGMKSLLGMGNESITEDEIVLNISAPTNVKHLQHIGYDPAKGFEVSNIPEEWKSLFKSAGIKPKDLKDKDTAQAIIQTVAKYSHDVRRKSQIEQSTDAVPSVPSRPSRAPPSRRVPPKIPTRAPPRIPTRNTQIYTPPVAPSVPSAAPSVPSAPLAPSAPAAPVAPRPSRLPSKSPTPSSRPQPGAPGRHNLLSEIRSGAKLKSVSSNSSTRPVPAPSPAPSAAGGVMGGLLSEIRGGKKLKSVRDDPKPIPDLNEMGADNQNDLASKIASMMKMRRKNIADHDHEEEDDDDEDW